MAKKIVKRKKLRVFPFFILLIILIGFFSGGYFYFQLPIQNILITNTKYLNDDYILELANIKNYPSFFTVTSRGMEKKLKASPYIKKAEVKRKFFHTFQIKVYENAPLFLEYSSNQVIFEDKTAVEESKLLTSVRIPRLLNYVPDNKYESFIKGMSNIKKEVLGKISDIEYTPNDYDKDRFVLYMDDGNMVYLTLTKFKMINYYNDVLSQLEGRKGILYLDNGNHFQIKE